MASTPVIAASRIVASATAATPAVPPATEANLMTELRAVASANPAVAVELAEDGNRRFPKSNDAPERTAILVKSLLALDRYRDARARAEQMQQDFPGNRWSAEIEGLTGAHSHQDQPPL